MEGEGPRPWLEEVAQMSGVLLLGAQNVFFGHGVLNLTRTGSIFWRGAQHDAVYVDIVL